jgi:hypothetical protein
MFNNFLLWKTCCLWDDVEKYGTARQATDDNIVWHMRFACWTRKATNTNSEYVIQTFPVLLDLKIFQYDSVWSLIMAINLDMSDRTEIHNFE